MKKLSIVIPCCNEELSIDTLINTFNEFEILHPELIFEYIYVNDGSTDATFEKLSYYAIKNHRIKVVDLSRNFGKEIALSAGVHFASDCDALITIDADLQHPVGLISEFLHHWKNGAEQVIGLRVNAKGLSSFKKYSSDLYYKIYNFITDAPQIPGNTDYRLYDSKVVEAFKTVTERERMFRGIMDWLGFKKVYVPFEIDERSNGVPTYKFSSLLRLALNSITSFSLWPLKIIGIIGLTTLIISSVLLIFITINYFFKLGMVFSAIAYLAIFNSFLIGLVLCTMGIVSLYIGTIHNEVVRRPLYLVRDQINIDI